MVQTPCEQIREGVWLKREDLQIGGSFKTRGVWNLLLSADPAKRAAGIVCVSSGNTGKAVCRVARELRCPVHVFVTAGSDPRKLEVIRNAGAQVVIGSESFGDTSASAQEFAHSNGMLFCSPGESWPFIYGVASVGLEISDLMHFTSVYVPIGGGGLASGVGLALETASFSRRPRLIGVQASSSPFVYEYFHQGNIATWSWSQSVADCLVGDLEKDAIILKVAHRVLDDVLLVEDDEILLAQAALDQDGIEVEAGAAAGYAAFAKEYPAGRLHPCSCIILTGAK